MRKNGCPGSAGAPTGDAPAKNGCEGISSVGYVPAHDRWEFDGSVAECFEDMLRRSIPQYDVMRTTCFNLACGFVREGTDVVDLGCSRGGAMAPLVDKFGARCRFVGVEISEPMLAVVRGRFDGLIRAGVVEIRETDLRKEYPPVRASVTMAVLVTMFLPINYRMELLRRVWEHTAPGGALIYVEKLLGSTAQMDRLLVERYHETKVRNGYTSDEIDRKRCALEGVLVPVTARWNEECLRAAGFDQVECFWRWMNFAGWVAVKEE